MKRGTRVAQAYTEMHVDGSSMNDEIAEGFDGAEGEGKKAGDKAGKGFGDHFDKAFADRISKKIGKSLDRSLEKSFKGMGKKIGKSLGDSISEGLGDRLELTFAGMLDQLEDKIVSGNGRGGGGGGPRKPSAGGVGDGTPDDSGLRTFYAAFERARAKLHADANAAIKKEDDDLLKAQQRIIDTAQKAHDKAAKDYSKAWTSAHAENIKRVRAAAKEFDRSWTQAIKENTKREADAARESERIMARRLASQRALGDRVGKLFGAGSRSNVLNLFGRTLGNVVNLTTSASRAASGLFSTFKTGFTQAAEGAGFFQKAISGFSAVGSNGGKGISGLFASIASTGPGAVVAIGAVIIAMSVLVSVASALTAILVALTATIASGLVGALGVGLGLFGPLIAAAGLLTAAFMSMDDAQKKMLKESFIPLREQVVGLGQVMIQQMVPAFSTWSSNLQRAVSLALPVAEKMGAAFARAGITITQSLSGPGFQRFAAALGTFLPGIVDKLSNALGQFLNGLTGLFAGLMPYVDRFAGYLEKVATRFSEWANSAEGQNAIADFMDRALVSLQSLWNTVKAFGSLFSAVFFSDAAQQAGNSIFDSLTRAVNNLTEKVNKAAANGDFKKWFDDAIKFGEKAWDMLEGIFEVLDSLNSSGVLTAVGIGIGVIATALELLAKILGPVVDLLDNKFSGSLVALAAGPLGALALGVSEVGKQFGYLKDAVTDSSADTARGLGEFVNTVRLNMNAAVSAVVAAQNAMRVASSAGLMISAAQRAAAYVTKTNGANAIANTTDKDAPYKNPYEAYARSLQDQADSISRQIKSAYRKMATALSDALREAASADSSDAARSALLSQSRALKATGEQLVSAARSALSSAASALGSANSKSAAKKALAEVRKAQADLARALKAQSKLQDLAESLNDQRSVNNYYVNNLLKGLKVQNATLADYARARDIITGRLEKANQKLADAINVRDSYRTQVAEGVRAFGALTTANASTVDGIQQALSYGDITSNLQDRLTKIKAFNENLRLLSAQGLSKEAYKQIVDAGVDGGSAFADALVAQGSGGIAQVNDLVSQIGKQADQLGLAASNNMYAAGVQAAAGLVAGLESQAKQLDAAATRLGNSIAKALKKALGIKSPSRVTMGMMDDVGDGAVIGLDNQHQKVGTASARLAGAIQITPEAAQASVNSGPGGSGGGGVSGNGATYDIDINVETPTEDPKAVAIEAVNELVARL